MQAKKFIVLFIFLFFIGFRYKTGNYFLVCSILITMIILVKIILNFHTI